MRDRSTNEPQGTFFLTSVYYSIGFGFIDFATEEDAINALNGYNGRPIRIVFASRIMRSGNWIHISFKFRRWKSKHQLGRQLRLVHWRTRSQCNRRHAVANIQREVHFLLRSQGDARDFRREQGFPFLLPLIHRIRFHPIPSP